jgi:hypothetical protein
MAPKKPPKRKKPKLDSWTRPKGDEWEEALRTLVQTNDGQPLAELLRNVMPTDGRGLGEIPVHAIYKLAELLDPVLALNPLGDRRVKQNAVRLKITPLPPKQLNLLTRNQNIWASMLGEIIDRRLSIQEAVEVVGEKFGLTGRQVTSIWARARKSQPMLSLVTARRPKKK